MCMLKADYIWLQNILNHLVHSSGTSNNGDFTSDCGPVRLPMMYSTPFKLPAQLRCESSMLKPLFLPILSHLTSDMQLLLREHLYCYYMLLTFFRAGNCTDALQMKSYITLLLLYSLFLTAESRSEFEDRKKFHGAVFPKTSREFLSAFQW